MRQFFITVISVFIFQCTYSQSCQIKGKVQTSNGKEKLSGAFVTCIDSHGKQTNTLTDFDGEFKIRNLAPGEYELKVDYVGYAVFDTHVTVKENDKSEIKVSLTNAQKSLARVDVFGYLSQQEEAGARQKEQRANNVVNVISAQAMERSPDINAANVLQRMSGLTVERNGGADEAYAVIRGLDPRYSNTLINGIKIASPDEKSRFVSLSIVPSDLLGSIEVHKTLTPDMEADAIGGTVNMVMKDAPEKKVFHVLGSLGYSKLFFDRKYEKFSTADIQQKSLIEKYGSTYTAKPQDFSR